MKHVFIINPAAGKVNVYGSLKKKIDDYFAKNPGDYEIFLSEYPGHIAEIVKGECEKNSELRIYVAGGDGTLNEAVKGSYRHKNFSVGIYPCGTGNDFVKTIYSDKAPEIEDLIGGDTVKCDLIMNTGEVGINISSAGFDAEVAKNVTRFKKLFGGNLAYTLSVFYCFLFKLKFNLNITIDEKTKFSGKFLLVVAANGRFYGGGFNPTPKADIQDGLLDFIVVKKVSRFVIAKLLDKYKKGEVEKLDKLATVLRGKKCEIECFDKGGICVNSDGETRTLKKVSFEILPGEISIIIPKNR